MEKISKYLVICAAGLLGLLSIGTAIAAELTKIKRSDIKVDTKCEYPNNPATIFGIIAMLALMMSQGILLAATGCSCCSKSTLSNNMNLRLQGFARFIFVMASMGLLLRGILRNIGIGSGLKGYLTSEGYYVYVLQCYYVRPGIFATASFLSGLSVLLGIIYFISITKNPNLPPKNDQENNIN